MLLFVSENEQPPEVLPQEILDAQESKMAPQYKPVAPSNKVCLVMAPTHACNLSCSYCMLQRVEQDAKVMEWGIAEAALELLCGGRGNRSIGFFGGEPMLAFDLIKRIVRASKRANAVSYGMTTNATLITEEAAQWMAGNSFSFVVSVDGGEETHNANRPLKNGEGSHAKTLEGLEWLHLNGLSRKVSARATFSDPRQAFSMVKWLNENLYQKGKVANISVECASFNESACTTSNPQEMDWEALAEAYWQIAEYMRDNARAGRSVRCHTIGTPLERLVNRRPYGSECGAGKGYFTVSPNGLIYACHRETEPNIGHVLYGFDERVRSLWYDNRCYHRSSCCLCDIRNLCGGGCRSDSAFHKGDPRIPWEVGCRHFGLIAEVCFWLLSELTLEEVKRITRPHARSQGERHEHGQD